MAYLNRAEKLLDYLISITDGLGSKTTIDYESLSNKKVNVYTKENNATYPTNVDWQGPMYVIYQTSSSTDISDPQAKARMLAKANNTHGVDVNNNIQDALNHVTTYHYAGAKFNNLGFGFLGFHKVSIKNETTGITKIITYGQDPAQHNIAKELSSETRTSDGTIIHSTTNQWTINYPATSGRGM